MSYSYAQDEGKIVEIPPLQTKVSILMEDVDVECVLFMYEHGVVYG
jgi:hypothetical protein